LKEKEQPLQNGAGQNNAERLREQPGDKTLFTKWIHAKEKDPKKEVLGSRYKKGKSTVNVTVYSANCVSMNIETFLAFFRRA